MSDISVAELRNHVDGVNIPPMATFNALKPEVIAKVENVTANPITSESVAMPAMPEKMTEEQLKKYNESVNEVVKGVVVRAKIVAEKNGNPENVKKYNELIESVIKREIMTPQELESRVLETKAQDERNENKIRAEAALKKVEEAMAQVEAAIKNIENFSPEDYSDIYLVNFELQGLLQLDLDPVTKSKVEIAHINLGLVIKDLEERVDKVLNPDNGDEVKNPLSIISGIFAPKFATN
jgi:hypothetical protein